MNEPCLQTSITFVIEERNLASLTAERSMPPLPLEKHITATGLVKSGNVNPVAATCW